MKPFSVDSKEANEIKTFIREDFSPRYGEVHFNLESEPLWRRLRDLGTELWLDTGDPEAISSLWTREFSAVTTNNTLLNQEVQKGTYDDLIPRAVALLQELGNLSEDQMRLELSFILNARHALRLVEQFDAYVSVEEHTDLANDMEGAVTYARRFYAICPERFFVKLPLSPAGILATRQLAGEGIPVNHTLGFSARQNYLIARIAQPAFVNVFLGRLNSFIKDNGLGDGKYVGEKAAIASQRMVRSLCETQGISTRQIGASLRNGEQVRDLAGLDVLTMPTKAAQPFLDMQPATDEIVDCTDRDYQPTLNDGVAPGAVQLQTLWDVPDDYVAAVEDLANEKFDVMMPQDLVDYMAKRGFPDLFPRWIQEHVEISVQEGKIPDLNNWRDMLQRGETGLDALMNLAAFNSFTTDQKSMDERVMGMLNSQ